MIIDILNNISFTKNSIKQVSVKLNKYAQASLLQVHKLQLTLRSKKNKQFQGNKVRMKKNLLHLKSQAWRSLIAHTPIASITLKICVIIAIENLLKSQTQANASTRTVKHTQEECAKDVISKIITKENSLKLKKKMKLKSHS